MVAIPHHQCRVVPDVRFGSKADMSQLQKVMSALPPKADMCSATRDVCFVPEADISLQLVYRLAAPGQPGLRAESLARP